MIRASLFAIVFLYLLASAQDGQDAYRRANELFNQQRYEQSLAAVEEALRQSPRMVPALTLKARLAMAANRYDVARQCLRQAVEIEPQNSRVQFLLGFCLYVENDFKNAQPVLLQSTRLAPDDAQAAFYLAMTFEALGRTEEAIAAYETTLKLTKTGGAALADPLVAYGRLLYTLGRYEESEKLIDRALIAETSSRDAHYEKGRLLMERRDYAKAIDQGKQALAALGEGTTDAQIHFLLARAYGKNGQKELSEFHLAKHRASPQSLRR